MLADKLWQRGKQEVANLLHEVDARISRRSNKIINDVPLVVQFTTPASAELSLTKVLSPINDAAWPESGASTAEEYARWAFTMCGMACTAMALEYFLNVKIMPVKLAEEAVKYGVYEVSDEEISDMRYREFATWIKDYGLRATVYSRLSRAGIELALSRGQLVIASVNPNIRGYKTAPIAQRGGHLVLVTGYDRTASTLTINNPSGFVSNDSQRQHTMTTIEFAKYFAGRGIVLQKF